MSDDNSPPPSGKFKAEKPHHHHNHHNRFHHRFRQFHLHKPSVLLLLALILLAGFLLFSYLSGFNPSTSARRSLRTSSSSAPWGGPAWEKRVRSSARIRRSPGGISVLVTGAAGFVGTHVSSALKSRGDGVLGLDSFNEYYEPSLKRARQALLDRAGVFVVEGDINDSPLLRKLLDVVPFTHVMHLAAQAGVRHALTHPSSYISANVAGLVSVLEAAKSADPQPAVVWASSSSVYGLNSRLPFSESDRTDKPASLYAATKKAGEEIAHVYNHIYGLSVTGLRFFTVYGPWGRPDMAYYFFTRNILAGRTVKVFDRAARDFTYIDDVVRGCLAALDTAGKSTGSGGTKRAEAQLRVFNLGNTSPVPVLELVRILERLLKVKAKLRVVPMPRNGDVQFTHANISLAMRELGYHPTTNIHSGLKSFVRWYLQYHSPLASSISSSSSRGKKRSRSSSG